MTKVNTVEIYQHHEKRTNVTTRADIAGSEVQGRGIFDTLSTEETWLKYVISMLLQSCFC